MPPPRVAIRVLFAKVATVQSLQDATSDQLNGMLPAILDQAFRGEP
jgi:hypothetical protein